MITVIASIAIIITMAATATKAHRVAAIVVALVVITIIITWPTMIPS